MRKKKFSKILFAAFTTALLFVILCITAGATDSSVQGLNQPDAVTIKELNIVTNHAILEGQTLQMQVEEFEEFVLLGSVEWSSSNPEVISCSKSGEIKGLKEGKATIKVKAKIGSASDSITVYCARRLKEAKSSRIKNWVAYTTYKPSFLSFQTFHVNIFPIWITGKLDVKGVYDSYFYVEFEREEKRFKGFIPRIWMPDDVASNEIFKQLSVYDLDVYVGLDRPHYVLTTNYEGEVKWNVSDNTIIDFNDETGKIRTLKPGIATISATVGNKTLVCTIHSIYHWPLEWTGAARQATCVYKAVGNTYKETATPLAVGDKFTVKADAGGDSEWAYGISENGTWGYVPISHISTKNTISYYSDLGWGYPLQNKSYNYVNSPYAPRPSLNDEHRGMDINEKSNQADIAGQALVAPFDGVVKWVGADLNTSNGCGYYICITSNTVDPVTGKNLIAIYQHMQSKAKFSINETVKKGDVVGYAGNTGRSEGSHLHFEVNNWNARIGESGRSDFTYTINPIYFYMDMVKNDELILNMDCSAVNSGYSFYFYNYDK